jgi:predicted PurR-regulated permease PerM
MEITSFILGVLAVIAIMMVVIASVNYTTIKVLKLQIDNLDKYANRIEQETNQRISTEVQNLSQRANNDDNEIVKYIDSRVDKLETKIYSNFDIKKSQSHQY